MKSYGYRLDYGLLVFGLVALCLVHQAGAVTVTVGASQDTTIYENSEGALSNGAGSHFFAGRNGTGGGQLMMRGLLKFDVDGHIPPGATINNVAIGLRVTTPIPHAGTVMLHSVSAPWGEGASIGGGMGEAAGATPTSGEATWIHSQFNTVFWAMPGGDFRPEASASLDVTDNGPQVIDSTPTLVADVQGWLDNPASNNGWLLRLADETLPAIRFASRQHPERDFQPQLVVDFSLPPLVISPPSGLYALTQVSDIVVFLNLPAMPTGATVLIDGADVSTDFAACLLSVPGTVVEGGQTFRCPSRSATDLGPGPHTFEVTVTLSDGSSVQEAVTWVVIENTEP